MTEAYPLQWPQAWPRVKNQQNAQFKVTMGEAVTHLYDELDRIGATNVVVSSNMRLRLDGKPYADQRRLEDEGVAVYFTLNGEQQCIPCDKWTTVKDNVRAIGLTIQALRGLDRWGAKEMVNAAFRGFKALPETAIVTPYTKRPWHEVLEVSPAASPEVVKAAYRQKMFKAHPDHGGSEAAFQEVQNALREAGL